MRAAGPLMRGVCPLIPIVCQRILVESIKQRNGKCLSLTQKIQHLPALHAKPVRSSIPESERNFNNVLFVVFDNERCAQCTVHSVVKNKFPAKCGSVKFAAFLLTA